ncbi:MAG: hypothetical protein AAF962_15675 [Actinomycetota bacterium]
MSPALAAAPVGDTTVIGFYLVYAAAAIGLVVFLARTLHRNGATFLTDVFDQPDLAGAVNQLLVIGFYLLNLGYAFLIYQVRPDYESVIEAFNQLTIRLGLLLLSLGVIHLLNMYVFWRIRTHRDNRYKPNRAAYGPPATGGPGMPGPGVPGPGGGPAGGPVPGRPGAGAGPVVGGPTPGGTLPPPPMTTPYR